METRNRTAWTVVVIVAVVAVLCCCVVVAAAAAGSWLLGFPFGTTWGPGVEGGEIDRAYDVGRSPQLKIDNFAGSITVRAGERGQFRVKATRHALRDSDLERIEVEIQPREGGVAIVTRNPRRLSNAWVRLEVIVPADTSFNLHTGSGNIGISGLDGGGKAGTSSGSVTARDMSGSVSLHTSSGRMSVHTFVGDLDAHTSSGGIDVRGAEGPVRLDTGSGSIDYQGSPVGDCSFKTGSGSIDLRLPSNLDARIDLHTGSGSIKVDFPVDGERSRHDVRGIIGSGDDASITARTGSGSIHVSRY
jgi:hypothetical protein